MKNIFKSILALTLLFFMGCEQETYELGSPPSAEDASIVSAEDPSAPNYITFSNTSSAFMKNWDFGNGSSNEGSSVTAYYPFAGEYTVTLTVYSKGGSIESTETVVITETDPEICNVEILKLLSGGCESPEGKTWVIAADQDGHMGLGPVTSFGPDWWNAGANEKTGSGLYNDEYTFKLNESVFIQETNGDVYINAGQAANFPGAVESPVGDYIAPYTAEENMNYAISIDSDGYTQVDMTNGGFVGYGTGVNSFKIISITANEMFIRLTDVVNTEFAWYHKLIRKGYTPEPPPPPEKTTLPVDFETVVPPFNGFGGSTYQVIDNPDATGINTSTKVGEYVKGYDGSWAGIETALDAKIDFSTNTTMEYKVKSPVTGRALFKLESQDGTATVVEVFADIAVANQWETLSFDFTGTDSDVYDKIALFLDFDNNNGGTFYFDDIKQPPPPPETTTLPVDFETVVSPFNGFGGSTYQVISNPDATGINTSAKVGEYVKGYDGSWAGIETALDAKLDFSTNTIMEYKVKSPVTGRALFKLESQDGTATPVEVFADITVANQWETLSFDFTGTDSNVYDKIALFLDFDNNNGGTFYFDDIIQTAPPATVRIDFETEDPAFGAFGGNAYSWIDNPDASGINTSTKVGKSIHGDQSWAGIEKTLSGSIDFSSNTTFKMKVKGPNTGTIKFKIEDSTDGNVFLEVDVTNTKTNEWEELSFDFSGAASGTYDKMALFFNFGTTDNTEVFLFDDIIQE